MNYQTKRMNRIEEKKCSVFCSSLLFLIFTQQRQWHQNEHQQRNKMKKKGSKKSKTILNNRIRKKKMNQN